MRITKTLALILALVLTSACSSPDPETNPAAPDQGANTEADSGTGDSAANDTDDDDLDPTTCEDVEDAESQVIWLCIEGMA